MSNKSIPAIFIGGPRDRELTHIRDDVFSLDCVEYPSLEMHDFSSDRLKDLRPNYKITTYTRRIFIVDEANISLLVPKGMSSSLAMRKILKAYVL